MTSHTAGAASAPASPLLVFLCALGLLTAVTAGVWVARPNLGGRVKNITRAERPSDDYYLAHDHGGHVDHHVMYFGTDPVALDHLKRADVILLGNSRLMFAARPRVLDAFFEARGLRYYVLGFGFREADRFPLAIIEKFDLKPRMVIVNADGFFENSLSDFARQVMKGQRLRCLAVPSGSRDGTRVPEGACTSSCRTGWTWSDGPGFPWRRELIIYRSRSNGTWQLSPWEVGTAPVGQRDPQQPPLGPEEIDAARSIQGGDGRPGHQNGPDLRAHTAAAWEAGPRCSRSCCRCRWSGRTQPGC